MDNVVVGFRGTQTCIVARSLSDLILVVLIYSSMVGNCSTLARVKLVVLKRDIILGAWVVDAVSTVTSSTATTEMAAGRT